MTGNFTQNTAIAVIGLGRVGAVLAVSLAKAGYKVAAVARSKPAAVEFCRTRGANLPTLFPAELSDLPSAEIIIFCVGDSEIAPLAERLTVQNLLSKGQIIAHCSGSMDMSALSACKKIDCLTASMHPLQSFPNFESGLAALPGIFWFVEGDAAAKPKLRVIVEKLSGQYAEIQSGQKAAYHTAVCMAANYLTSLIAASESIATQNGIDADLFRRALEPILTTTLRNTVQLGPVAALTGPIRRGDDLTVQRHIAEIRKLGNHSNGLMSIYQSLGEFTKNHLLENNASMPIIRKQIKS